MQILVKLCTFVSPAEELAQKDDLQLLFSAITSWCPPHNLPWRRSAGEVLTTISRHGLSVNVVKYIHGMYKRTVRKGHLFLEVTVFQTTSGGAFLLWNIRKCEPVHTQTLQLNNKNTLWEYCWTKQGSLFSTTFKTDNLQFTACKAPEGCLITICCEICAMIYVTLSKTIIFNVIYYLSLVVPVIIVYCLFKVKEEKPWSFCLSALKKLLQQHRSVWSCFFVHLMHFCFTSYKSKIKGKLFMSLIIPVHSVTEIPYRLHFFVSNTPYSVYREGMLGYMCSKHAAVRRSLLSGDRWDVCRPLLLPQRLQRRVADPAGRFPNVPGLHLPLRPHAQVQLRSSFLQFITGF